MEKPYKILIALEDRVVAEDCQARLGDSCVVTVVDSSEDVYEVLHDVAVDLAVLDYSLSNVNPIELHEGMALLHPNTTVVLCVTSENREVATRIWKKRALDYIQKPFDGPLLVDNIHKVLRHIVAQDYIRKLEQRILKLEEDVKKLKGE